MGSLLRAVSLAVNLLRLLEEDLLQHAPAPADGASAGTGAVDSAAYAYTTADATAVAGQQLGAVCTPGVINFD